MASFFKPGFDMKLGLANAVGFALVLGGDVMASLLIGTYSSTGLVIWLT